jgi:tripartite-type tricarboxylate transporter receptor subunit TctC
MTLPRRRFLHLAASIAALSVAPRVACAQAYPVRPVRIVVPFAPGGPNDILARLMGQWLSGYTLLQVGPSHAINATLFEKLNFNFIRDIAPIATLVSQPQIMLVHPSVPVTTTKEFIAYAKKNPGRLNMASAGTGTGPHLTGELFKMMAGVDLVHVPYRGAGPAIVDLLGGQVQVAFIGPPASIDHIRTGKLRALAVTSATRWDGLPDVPAVDEFVQGYEASSWFGFGAPRNTSAEIIDKLNREINEGLASPKMKSRLADLGGTVLSGSPEDFGKLIADETEKWAKVVKFSGAKAG